MTNATPDSVNQTSRSPGVRLIRRILVLAIGLPVTLLGLVFLVAPGPGTPLLIAGLAILAIEFAWAQRHMDRIKAMARRVLRGDDTDATR